MNDATQAQNTAARHNVSTWLTANAGSGKTRVLTNRVARLLLNGVRPESILCLTYTTAAASEMQNRLFKTLGTWAMLPDQHLRTELRELGEVPPEDLGRARTLFASAIEAPGGLKIQTIHSFCSKVLRQFPLEAGVNPQFRELDEAAQSTIVSETIEDIAIAYPDALMGVEEIYSGQNVADIAKEIAKRAEDFFPVRSKVDIFRAFGLEPNTSLTVILAQAIEEEDITFLKTLIPLLKELGSSNDHKLAEALSRLADSPGPADLTLLEDCLLTKDSAQEPFSFSSRIPTQKVKRNAVFAPLLSRFVEIGHRVELARQRRMALESSEETLKLHEFASVFLPCYAQNKALRGVLDFDDLIRKTKRLLTTRSLAWVLYRLDGRIDHVLVDEAQDTSPAQWDIIEALTSEIVAAESDRLRTLFVVGDKKQSIYSFQGADATGFDDRGEAFRRQLEHGPGLAKGELLHSFRSSPAILNVVDAVFSGRDGTGEATQHRAFHPDMPGRVDLWPLEQRPDQEDALPWFDTRDRTVENDAPHQLAEKIACYIAELIKSGSIQGKSGDWRRVTPGDIMILVQRRSAFFDKIIAACKSREIAIAGADRLKIGSELAVRDILALLSFLALPEDDLSLASALRSPLFGWTETELFRLASNRKSHVFLWQALRERREEFPDTFEALSSLRDRVDFDRPFELIHAILTAFDGRRRLVGRLGPEAEDGIDELLNQALTFERSQVPTLTGFLSTVRASDIEVKRETEATGDVLRVMTVHGAKGLESPIVILPDTTIGVSQSRQTLVRGPNGIPTLTRNKNRSTEGMQSAKSEIRDAEAAERERLLYVAMTRAQKWLIVTGVEPGRNSSSGSSWHENVTEALKKLGAEPMDTPTGSGLRYAHGTWSSPDKTCMFETESALLAPNRTDFGPLTLPKRGTTRSPSDLGGAKVLAMETDQTAGGLRRGRQMHLLLEHLPGTEDMHSQAITLLAHGPDAAGPEEIDGLVCAAMQIIEAHEDIFGPNSLEEVEIVGESETLGQRISGAIDRLHITETQVTAVDFKTNAIAPDRPEDTPEGILRQMGAYLEVLETIYPNRDVRIAILWTATGQLMHLPHGIVRDALRRATTS